MSESDVVRIVGEVKIAKLSLSPGDVLVVKVDRTIDSFICSRIYGSIKPHVPDGVKVLVIDPAVELSVLKRSDIEQMAG